MKIKSLIISGILLLSLFFGSIADAQVHEILLGKVGHPLYTLTITGSGDGTGTVTGSMNCTSTAGEESGVCSQQYPMGAIVTLTPTAISGSMFNGWTGSGCTGTGACSILIDGNKTVDAEFLVFPYFNDLVAFYKVNEGSGTTVANSASPTDLAKKWPDLTVYGNLDYFWNTLSGFGTGASTVYCYTDNGSAIGFGPKASIGGFKRYRSQSGTYTISMVAATSGTATNHNMSDDLYGGASRVDYGLRINNSGVAKTYNQFLYATQLNKWVFVFSIVDLPNNKLYIHVVRDDGVRIIGTTTGSYTEVTYSPRYFKLFRFDATYYWNGQIGDFVAYHNRYLTEADFAIIYDKLRTRYGMAARSGW